MGVFSVGTLQSGQCRESLLGCSMSYRGLSLYRQSLSLVDALIMRGGTMT